MIEAVLTSTEVSVATPIYKLLSLILIAATTYTSVVPAFGICTAASCEHGAKTCCGACCAKTSAPGRSCCSKSERPRACHCSVDEKRPAVPQERRTSDERNDARRTECVVSVLFVGDDVRLARAFEDASLLSSRPALRRQSILCRWLV